MFHCMVITQCVPNRPPTEEVQVHHCALQGPHAVWPTRSVLVGDRDEAKETEGQGHQAQAPEVVPCQGEGGRDSRQAEGQGCCGDEADEEGRPTQRAAGAGIDGCWCKCRCWCRGDERQGTGQWLDWQCPCDDAEILVAIVAVVR